MATLKRASRRGPTRAPRCENWIGILLTWYALPVISSRARPLTVMVLLLAALAACAPTIDAMLFGPHDHIADATQETDRTALAGHPDLATPHHCELSANPAGTPPIMVAETPVMLTWALSETILSAALHAPSAPLAPPRA